MEDQYNKLRLTTEEIEQLKYKLNIAYNGSHSTFLTFKKYITSMRLYDKKEMSSNSIDNIYKIVYELDSIKVKHNTIRDDIFINNYHIDNESIYIDLSDYLSCISYAMIEVYRADKIYEFTYDKLYKSYKYICEAIINGLSAIDSICCTRYYLENYCNMISDSHIPNDIKTFMRDDMFNINKLSDALYKRISIYDKLMEECYSSFMRYYKLHYN